MKRYINLVVCRKIHWCRRGLLNSEPQGNRLDFCGNMLTIWTPSSQTLRSHALIGLDLTAQKATRASSGNALRQAHPKLLRDLASSPSNTTPLTRTPCHLIWRDESHLSELLHVSSCDDRGLRTSTHAFAGLELRISRRATLETIIDIADLAGTLPISSPVSLSTTAMYIAHQHFGNSNTEPETLLVRHLEIRW